MKSKSVKTKIKVVKSVKTVKKTKVPISGNPLYLKFGRDIVEIEGNKNGAITRKELHIDADQIKRLKKDGKYIYNKFDYDELMGALVHMVSMCNRKLPFGNNPIEITDFSISVAYKTTEVMKHPDVNDMRAMVNGSQRLAWLRPGDKE